MKMLKINTDATHLDQIISNEDWCLEELYPNIYKIYLGEVETRWLVKINESIKHAKKEIDNLTILSSVVGVPKILGCGMKDKFSFIIMERAEGEDLYNIDTKREIPEKELKMIVKHLLLILKEVHSLGIVHRDIKPENVVYDAKSKNVTLIDFEGKRTDGFESPEYIKGGVETGKSDVWSVGILVYDLLRGRVPFRTRNEILRKSLTFSRIWSDALMDFLSCVLEKEPDLRYGVDDALNHIWLN